MDAFKNWANSSNTGVSVSLESVSMDPMFRGVKLQKYKTKNRHIHCKVRIGLLNLHLKKKLKKINFFKRHNVSELEQI